MDLSTYQEYALSSETILKLVAQEQVTKLQALVKTLQAEIRRLKKLSPKPDIKPNKKPKQDESKESNCFDNNGFHEFYLP